MKINKSNIIKFPGPKMKCPDCLRTTIITNWEVDNFKYGIGENPAELSVKVPVRSCSNCGIKFTDYISEDLREETVGAYLKMKIKGIFKNGNLY